MKKILNLAMFNPDELVIEFMYRDRKGQVTRRVVSPIRFIGEDRFLALCLSREEPRQFVIEHCVGIKLRRACNYLMPVEMLPVVSAASAMAV